MDDVQTQLVLLDDTVDSFVSRASDCLSRILNRTAVAHLDQKLDDEPFENAKSCISTTSSSSDDSLLCICS